MPDPIYPSVREVISLAKRAGLPIGERARRIAAEIEDWPVQSPYLSQLLGIILTVIASRGSLPDE